MPNITVTTVDGDVKRFEHNRGDRYEPSVSYEICFVVITDRFGVEVSIPAATIKRIDKGEPWH